MSYNSEHGSDITYNDSCITHQQRGNEVGMERKQFDVLIEISSIHSKKIIPALYDHLVNGVSRKEVCQQHGVNAGYLSVCIRRLSRIEKLVMELARFY